MEVKAGCYYRREDGAIVKVLHENVKAHVPDNEKPRGPFKIGTRSVVYRFREGAWPTTAEHMFYELFVEQYEGPLGWDEALNEFKTKVKTNISELKGVKNLPPQTEDQKQYTYEILLEMGYGEKDAKTMAFDSSFGQGGR